MSATTDAWSDLYGAQTDAIGTAILATITGHATNKPAILTEVDNDAQIIEGGIAEAGGFELQMLQSDVTGEPAKNAAVTCNGAATGQSLYVLNAKLNNGVWYVRVGDFAIE